MDELCKYHDVKRQVYIDLLQICSRRDSGCHNACPQLEDYLDGTEEVNWDQVWFACKDRKSIAKNLFQQGRIDEIQLESLQKAIDVWFKVHVSGWGDDGSPKLVENIPQMVKKLVDELKKAAAKPPVKIPDSPYKEGKWDDIHLE